MGHAACWAHARRQFFEAVQLNPRDPVATSIVARMDELFAVDAEARRKALSTNSMRPVALGRKNWIHIGSPQAGPKVAAILSVVESCRRLKLPVRDYLATILPGLADLPIRRLPELTPKAWVSSSCSRTFVSFPVGRGLASPCSFTIRSRGESSLESADRSGGDRNPDPGVWKA